MRQVSALRLLAPSRLCNAQSPGVFQGIMKTTVLVQVHLSGPINICYGVMHCRLTQSSAKPRLNGVKTYDCNRKNETRLT